MTLAFKVVKIQKLIFKSFSKIEKDFDCDNCLEHTNEAETQQTYLS